MPAVPPFDGIKPYQQIPTQNTLHILRELNGELKHREFLAATGVDPRRYVAERLADMSSEEVARARKQLLHYRELDTLAMVRIWEKLAASIDEIHAWLYVNKDIYP